MSDDQGAVHCEYINHVALITLDRPRALNALSHTMVLRLLELLDKAEADTDVRAVAIRGAGPKAFCAGGDVIAVASSVREGGSLHRAFFIDEYQLDLRIHTFGKPVVAFMHGIVMGGGMGLVQGAALRLVADNVRMAMPETRIGLIPDVGASHFFSKMSAPLAAYLALTGVSLGASDALFAGLADARCCVNDPEALPALLNEIEWPEPGQAGSLPALRRALAQRSAATDIEGALLPAQCPLIFRHFDPASPLQALVAGLESSADEWAQATARTLRGHAPLMLALTLEALQRGRHLSLPDCFKMEYGLVQHALACGEFMEGVRAHLIDKDRSPTWRVPSIEALTPALIEAALLAANETSSSFSSAN
ncbi:MAG: enoyl-CoA hydratase/isomerase family protein [Rubrivivax sp.]|nr:MAG: enoyl-CoA hydratase/isomerase family protein [Rubrivivax sp.]